MHVIVLEDKNKKSMNYFVMDTHVSNKRMNAYLVEQISG